MSGKKDNGKSALRDKIYGIDLGTTNSCIAVLQDGKPHVVPVDGSGIVPSVVSFDGKDILVGRKAWNRAAAFPEQSVRSVKRLMGTSEKLALGNKNYDPEDISAMILRYLCDEAQRLEGQEVKKVVITVPAYFSDAQRRATVEAGRRAGLSVERIVNEPTAAALFYGQIRSSLEGADVKSLNDKWKHALVYDLGGGTFDVSVLRMDEIIEVLSSTGDTHLGGDDFDRRLVDSLLEELRNESGLDLSGYTPALARFSAAAESAKIVLSEKASALIEEAHIPTPSGRTGSVSKEFTRNEFEAMTGDFLDRTLDSVQRALSEAKLSSKDIDRVLLVGGMTRMPVVAERLTEIFGDARLPAVDPDLSVAKGAAIQGGIISGENVEQILVDVTSHTLSLEVLDHTGYGLECHPIIPRNTPIPATRARIFSTVHDRQEAVDLRVYQGESLLPHENTLIGETCLDLERTEANSPVSVEYSYDLNGIVHLVAEHKGYSRKTEIRFDSRNPQANRTQRLDMLEEGTEPDSEEVPVSEPINFVTRRARTLLAKMQEGERRDSFAELLGRYEKALKDEDDAVDSVEDELLDALDEFRE